MNTKYEILKLYAVIFCCSTLGAIIGMLILAAFGVRVVVVR